MLFNSTVFILGFLPVTLVVYFWLARAVSARAARGWLVAASLFFYGWWGVSYLVLLVAWIAGNFLLSRRMMAAAGRRHARWWLIAGIAANIGLLAYFKYSYFIVETATTLTGITFANERILLPLAISFHTFQQIAYLVDVHRGATVRYSFTDYLMFVTFFPQLIAGPIVHHYELLPQFGKRAVYRPDPVALSEGIAFFVIGLVKKLCIADPLSKIAAPLFAASATSPPGFLEAWAAAVAFGLGLYFDFSAYSDMAVGLARMFGIRLPYNFASPYQATSIIDFWRRWHITLSRWLRDYLYIPLGGNRRGPLGRYGNLMATMLLGGLWHGAAWTFVIWGGLHGVFLIVNHLWNDWVARSAAAGRRRALHPVAAQALTLAAVSVAWVFFAAPSLAAALSVIAGMAGLHGFGFSDAQVFLPSLTSPGAAHTTTEFVSDAAKLALLAAAGVIVLFLPNSQTIVDGAAAAGRDLARHSAIFDRLRFAPTPASAALAACGMLIAFSLVADVKEFVYFQF